MTGSRPTAALILVGFGAGVGVFLSASPGPNAITGVVRDEGDAVRDALVRVQATSVHARTGADGRFTLSNLVPGQLLTLTAFAPGYYIAGPISAVPGDVDVTFGIVRHTTEDHASYEWVAARGPGGAHCQGCHSDPTLAESMLPFDEWQRDAHGTAAVNRRFLSMYNGTDLNGQHRSPETRYGFHADYGRFPLLPDSTQPYYGSGFKLDDSQTAGNCATCHTPAAAVNAPYATDPNSVRNVGREGITCDVCHKLWAVTLDPATRLPYPNRPGVLSIEFRRPAPDRQLFIGPFDDVAPGDDTYSPLQNRSEFCAPCHSGEFWGVSVYNSFGEWRNSSFSDPVEGRTCQDCHMPRRGAMRVALAEKGGRQRDADTIFSHQMPGASDVSLLRDAARLELKAERQRDRIRVEVRVTNEKAGHHIPTDHPARNILLVVSATDAKGSELRYVGNQVVPAWGGVGRGGDDYAGRPGKGYAKILEELWTGISPTAAYWRPTVLREDIRIPAKSTDVTNYEFIAPAESGDVLVQAKLIFRRAFKGLADQKRWAVPDIVMATSRVAIRWSP